MALVFPHEGPGKGILGKFLGDGLEYLACIRHERFIDFYLFPECYTKCKTIEVFEKDSEHTIYKTKLYNISSNLDYVAIGYSKRGAYDTFCKYWNTTELVDVAGEFRDMIFPSRHVAPGLFIQGKCRVQRENEVVFDKELSEWSEACCYLLDEDTIAIFDEERDVYKLGIWSMKRNQLISSWTHDRSINFGVGLCVSYVSRDDRSKIIILGKKIGFHVVDISQPEALDITDRFNGEYTPYDIHEFLFYDDATGFPVFVSLSFGSPENVMIFDGHGFSELSSDIKIDILNERYILSDSDVHEIVIDEAKKLTTVYKTSLPILTRTEHTYRDLAGTVYLDLNGVLRESFAFSTSGVLSSEPMEPVTNVFQVGKDCVLISGGKCSTVVDINAAKEVESWYKPEETLFACENFQIYKVQGKSRLSTKDKEIELPFEDACLFASSGTSIVVASTTKVAIIELDLEVNQTIEEDSIISVFSEGCVCKSGVKLFKNPERNVHANDLVTAHLFDDVLFTVSINGELRSGQNQERVDLMLEKVHSLRTSGNNMVISGTNDTYVYSKGEYFSIEAGEYESILVSNDNQVCITLLDGIVYLKTNAGFRMVKKKVGGIRDYRQVSVCNDKLMCHQPNNATSENNVIVKYITGDVTNKFRKCKKNCNHDLVLFSETHFLDSEHCYFSISSLQNPELKVYKVYNDELWPEDGFNWRTNPSLQCDNKLYASYRDYKESIQTVFKDENGTLYCCGEGSYTTLTNSYDGDGVVPYTLGLQPSNYPRSGDHWVVYGRLYAEDSKWRIQLIPKSSESILLDECNYIGELIEEHLDSVSCIRSADDSGVYYCASAEEVYKVPVEGAQETIATIKCKRERPEYISTKYTVNHGSKIKYEPDFIIADTYPTTITILQPSEAGKLTTVQKELIGDPEKAEVVSEIDGRFLLSAVMDTKNEVFFTKHGIDSEELKKDLFELFK